MSIPTINNGYLVFSAIMIGLVIVLPFVAAAIAQRRLGVSWRYFGYGALIFFLFQIISRVPAVLILQTVFRQQIQDSPLWQGLWLAGLLLTAGLFEEGGRYIGYRRFMADEEKTWPKGVMYGLGHGGIESAVLVGGLAIVQLIGLMSLGKIPEGTLSTEQLATVTQQINQINSQPIWFPLLAVWERFAAICFHVAMSVTVLQVFRRGQLGWLWLAIACHVVFNLVTLVSLLKLSVITTQALTTGFLTLGAALSLWWIWRLRDSNSVKLS